MQPENKVKWYYQPWLVILLLVFVLGPFGLPLVYKSPRFSKPWKIIITIIMVFFTIYLIYTTYEICKGMLSRIYTMSTQNG